MSARAGSKVVLPSEKESPMPSAQAQAHNQDDGRIPPQAEPEAAPIGLADVDRLLAESAQVSRADPAAPLRAWRDDLSVALAALMYAQAILSADAAVLRHCLASPPFDHKDVVNELPTILATEAHGHAEGQPADPAVLGAALALDPAVIGRADVLVSPHREIATIDLTEPGRVRWLLERMERQLGEVSGRRGAVEARLGDIRAAIVRQYRDGNVPPAESWLQ